ncbi:oxygen-independent coproporphyrinogen III oxidase [Mitsuaria sp. GD03876]|uniref:oxygen-independent coproporphyrinogen III oxidase n=1 Tax=Mitsuaria sp. GD03876 TaxID=2975399 RepID=UPI00244C52E0|nr:oxygen-independent coproporphyrinogen III oxidase [Mitsuaria sp. GD03876]MDH0866309.1 oxygen-independent coproporphyrinogen III oxidase [Mitsuaria sp. GD03876]
MSPDTTSWDRSIPDADLLRRFDIAGPRYTSYPTADRFHAGVDAAQHAETLALRAFGPVAQQPMSVYVHIPFCESVCYYCACNKVVTRHHERAAAYVDALALEMALVQQRLGTRALVSQLHFGGGTPTFLSDGELSTLMALLHRHFRLCADAEISIEVDPRTIDVGRLRHLRTLGFNRLSFGVQDFDPDVQRAVHREQSLESVAALMGAARDLGFRSINVDLIHGLPLQTPASFARTVEQVASLRPDRIALYAYAHLPHRFKPQRRIEASALPQPADKLRMLSGAIAGFIARGYSYIGMDHFALADDPLAVAKREGRLHRNFQGYSTQPDCDLVALGVSAISKVGSSFAQNVKTLPEYYAALREGRLPIERGLSLDQDDLVRRDAIMALMCQGRLAFDPIERSHGIVMTDYFAPELARLRRLEADGLVTLEPRAVQVTPMGWFFVRAVAMVFDRYLKATPAAASAGVSASAPEAPEAPVRFSRIL